MVKIKKGAKLQIEIQLQNKLVPEFLSGLIYRSPYVAINPRWRETSMHLHSGYIDLMRSAVESIFLMRPDLAPCIYPYVWANALRMGQGDRRDKEKKKNGITA